MHFARLFIVETPLFTCRPVYSKASQLSRTCYNFSQNFKVVPTAAGTNWSGISAAN